MFVYKVANRDVFQNNIQQKKIRPKSNIMIRRTNLANLSLLERMLEEIGEVASCKEQLVVS